MKHSRGWYTGGVEIVAAMLVTLPSYGLTINGYNANRHERFDGGSPGASVNTNWFAEEYDWSGVGWDQSDPRQSLTLISPRHFICANHWRPSGTVQFRDRNGVVNNYTIDHFDTTTTSGTWGTDTSDLVVGTLSTATSDTNYYPLLWPTITGTEVVGSWYVGRELIVYGQNGRAGRNIIDNFGIARESGENNRTYAYLYDYDTANGFDPDEAGAVEFDSGSPGMMVWNDGLTVLGTHFLVSGSPPDVYDTIDTLAIPYLGQLDSIMTEEGYNLSVIPIIIPEPGTLIVTGFAALLFLWRRQQPGVCRPA